ncbi:MAG: error-prone DNA polymerase [Pseudomonadota bacterium]|nr:error-prone DNA polymerase [Pseudomonadota bacterium]
MYSELHCFTNFSFLKGASHPEELVQQASALGYQALAITDECSVAGVVRAHVAARDLPLHLIVGSDVVTEEQLHLVILAPTRRAYGQLCTLITRARGRSEKGHYQLKVNDLHPATHECLFIWLPSPGQCRQPDAAAQRLLEYCGDRLWIGLENNLRQGDHSLLQQRQLLAQQLGRPVVACGNVHCHVPERQPLQDILTATRLNTHVHSAGFQLHANRETSLRPLQEIQTLYPQEAIAQTRVIAERCRFSLGELRYEYPREVVPPGHSAQSWLRQRVETGATERWPEGIQPRVREQIEKELALIHELRYEYYFLTVHDIVEFARSQKILCQGRGSAANSVVCFCLFITEVDPAKSNLLFERFISRERNEPPDIDVDFEHERREEVIQFIYRKYGRQRAALTATLITYRIKSAIRDVGKAMGFDQTLLDQLAKSISWWDKQDQLPTRLQELGIDIRNPRIKQFKKLVDTLLGFPRHLSQHVGGFIISAGPLDQLVPIENAAMAERTVVQWDKDDIEALGLMKVDVLALGMLSAIRKSFDLINDLRGQQWTLATLPQDDPDTYHLLQQGDSVGIFQVESRAQMAMLPRLKPACFYDLVIEVAIVRPGPIQGDMVHPFLRRRQGLEAVSYVSEEVKQVLQRTLGVPIFQEQVIELAMVAAGFSAGEADQLRRAMAAWKRKGQLQKYEEKLAQGLLSRGYSIDFAQRIISQIRGFGEYGFPESHAASFALLVYASAWLKRHEPAAFCCALLNSQPMGFYSPSQLVQDVKRRQVEVRGVDVQYSQWDHSLETDALQQHPQRQPAIRLGLRLVKGLSHQSADTLLQQRAQSAFQSMTDLQQRCRLNKRDMDALAHADAFGCFNQHRFQARWEVQGLQQESPLIQQQHQQETTVTLPAPSEAENLNEDYHSLGLTLGKHPMALLRDHPQLKGYKRHQDLYALGHKRFVRIAGLVTGRQRPGTATGVVFLTLEDETGNSNIVVWRDLVERNRAAVVHSRMLKIKGVVEREGSVIHVIAGHIEDCSHLLGELETRSRDFH